MTAAQATGAALTARDVLPIEETTGTFVGRVWDPARGVPVPVALRGTQVWDVTELAGTSASLLERAEIGRAHV